MFDVNLHYGYWPLDHLPEQSPKEYIAALEKQSIHGGLISGLETVFQRDTEYWNNTHFLRFRDTSENFIPVMTINPVYVNWQEQADQLKPQVVRILPNYHGYSLDRQELQQLCTYCIKHKIVMLLTMRLEDERAQLASSRVPGLETEAVIKIANRYPKLTIIALSAYFHEAIKLVEQTNNIYVETSFIERFPTLTELLKHCPAERIIFGSHSPLFYTDANIRKITGSGLDSKITDKIAGGNAARLLSSGKLR